MSGNSGDSSAQGARPADAEKLSKRLALISEIARTAMSKLEVGDLLTGVSDAISRSFGYYDVSIFLVEPETNECALAAQSGEFAAADVKGYRQKVGAGIVGWVAQHGKTILANDVRREPRHIVAFPGEEKSLSELAVPIRLHDRTVGVINIENREVNAFDDCDVMALETLAEQAAQAIANAQLFEHTRRLRDLSRSITDAVPSALCVLSEKLAILYTNPMFCSVFGCDEQTVSGRPAADVLPWKQLEGVGIGEAVRQALQEKTRRVFNDVSLTCAGSEKLLNVRVAPAKMPEGAGVLLLFGDVTEWRQAAALAEERRAHLDLILSHVPFAIVSFDLAGNFTFWGSGAKGLSGYSEPEIIGKATARDLVGSESEVNYLIDQCRKDGSAEGELRLRRKDATQVPVLVVLVKLLDRSQQHEGYTAFVLDITERHRAEEALRREQQKLDDVVGVMGAGLALIGRDKKIAWANRTIEEWFGRGVEVEGRLCHEVYCNRDTACAVCPAEECFATGRSSELDGTLVRADGTPRQYHHAAAPVIGPSGQVEQVLQLTLDVTEQAKKVYEISRLRQLGELMQGVLELDRLLHFILTCVTAGQALGFNRAALMLLDSDRNVLEGRMGVGPGSAEEAARIWSEIHENAATLEDLLERHDAGEDKDLSPMQRIAQSIQVSLEDTSSIFVECALGRKPIVVDDATNDPRVPADFRAFSASRQFVLAPLIAHNQPVGVIMADNLFTGQPITQEDVELLSMFANQAAIAIENAENYERVQEEKSHLEQAYRDLADAQDKLVRSERLVAIGRMSTHVAHEIRNPLVTIGGFADALIQQSDVPTETVTRYCQIIVSEVRRLEKILARVMDFSKPSGPLLRATSLGPLIRETLEQLRSRTEQCRVTTKVNLPESDVRLDLDPDQMKQVFINLFQNALDVMRDGGTLTVKVERDDQHVRIVVGNTGEPIHPEDMPNIFEPFFSTKPSGTGLGLAVSQKIAQDHGGDIRAASSLERGTEFTITLPLEPRAAGPVSYPGTP